MPKRNCDREKHSIGWGILLCVYTVFLPFGSSENIRILYHSLQNASFSHSIPIDVNFLETLNDKHSNDMENVTYVAMKNTDEM